jgi:hypothetical protein
MGRPQDAWNLCQHNLSTRLYKVNMFFRKLDIHGCTSTTPSASWVCHVISGMNPQNNPRVHILDNSRAITNQLSQMDATNTFDLSFEIYFSSRIANICGVKLLNNRRKLFRNCQVHLRTKTPRMNERMNDRTYAYFLFNFQLNKMLDLRPQSQSAIKIHTITGVYVIRSTAIKRPTSARYYEKIVKLCAYLWSHKMNRSSPSKISRLVKQGLHLRWNDNMPYQMHTIKIT